jgi:hypothetical protein
MTRSLKFICIMLAAAAVLPSMAAARSQQDPMARVEVRHYVPLTTACPGVLKDLPENLYPAWRAIDSAAEVVVDFKLEDGKAVGVTMSGGHGDYVGPVRHAVKAMKCSQAGEGAYAVRFRIKFQYPEDKVEGLAAVQITDEMPVLAAR